MTNYKHICNHHWLWKDTVTSTTLHQSFWWVDSYEEDINANLVVIINNIKSKFCGDCGSGLLHRPISFQNTKPYPGTLTKRMYHKKTLCAYTKTHSVI